MAKEELYNVSLDLKQLGKSQTFSYKATVLNAMTSIQHTFPSRIEVAESESTPKNKVLN